MNATPIPVLITGASGRMGATLCSLVRADNRFTLAGVLDRPEMLQAIAGLNAPAGSDLDAMLEKNPGSVIIDFTAPEASLNHARTAARHGAALVIGTTGLTAEHMRDLEDLGQKNRLFWAPNMSVGVNVLLRILPDLVRMLGENYDLEVTEIHHSRKKDAPSGTALALARCLAKARDWKLEDVANYHREGITGERQHKEIGVQALRGGDIPGIHTVYCLGPGERIEVSHHAHTRENFAQGALRAAAWLYAQKPGKLYSMQDVL